jgi:multimeric flavodoxin WrbA
VAAANEAAAVRSRLLDPCNRLLRYLESKNDILFLTTSTRFSEHSWDVPKTTQLANRLKAILSAQKKRLSLLDVSQLLIYDCEGNISGRRGNDCGVKTAKLRDLRKNPTGHHRCWASINNPDDQLYRVSRALFNARAVVFFVSVRWGQTNGVYQRLFERLSWIENRVSSLHEAPIPQLTKLEAGMVLFGQNWNNEQVLHTQTQNFKWFGWKTPAALSFNWQYTDDMHDESPDSYRNAADEFQTMLHLLAGKK